MTGEYVPQDLEIRNLGPSRLTCAGSCSRCGVTACLVPSSQQYHRKSHMLAYVGIDVHTQAVIPSEKNEFNQTSDLHASSGYPPCSDPLASISGLLSASLSYASPVIVCCRTTPMGVVLPEYSRRGECHIRGWAEGPEAFHACCALHQLIHVKPAWITLHGRSGAWWNDRG